MGKNETIRYPDESANRLYQLKNLLTETMKTILEIILCLAIGVAFIAAPIALRALLALLGLV